MGVTTEIVSAGDGKTFPKTGNTVTTHVTGYAQASGEKFWSTKDPGQQEFSFKIGLGQVIRGWDEGVAKMSLGERSNLTITGDYAYGEKGFPSWKIYPNATLIFDIELLRIA